MKNREKNILVVLVRSLAIDWQQLANIGIDAALGHRILDIA